MSSPILTRVLLFAGILAAAVAVSADDEAPSHSEVEAALSGEIEDLEAWEARFRDWGDAAMPHLEAIAQTDGGLQNAPRMARVLLAVGTERAARLAVRIVDRKTALPGFFVLSEVDRYEPKDPFLAHMLAEPAFKPAALRWFEPQPPPFSELADMVLPSLLQLCAIAEWKDQVPRIREYLAHASADVRTAAARALWTLTGEEVEVERIAYRFPGKAIVSDLVGEPVLIPRQRKRDPEFLDALRWFDGTPHVVYGFDEGVRSFGHTPELRIATGTDPSYVAWALPHEALELALLPTAEGERQLVVLGDEEGLPGRSSSWETVTAWTPEAKLRWRWSCPDRFVRHFAVLYGPEAPLGVVVGPGGDEGLIALDLEGRVLCAWPDQYLVKGLRTHAALPGVVLQIGSEERLLRYADGAFEVLEDLGKVPLFVTRGLLFPDDRGRPAVVLAGESQYGDAPSVCRVDAGGNEKWRVQVPVEITGLAMIEPTNAPRLFVVTTDEGELLLIDENGVLRWQGTLPFARPDGGVATIRLAAGEIAPGEYGILIKQIQSCYVIPVHVHGTGDAEDR